MQGHEATCAFLTTNNKRDCWCEVKRYGKAAAITGAVLVGQYFVVVYSLSLALGADTVHVASDLSIALGMLLVSYVGRYLDDEVDENARMAFTHVAIALLVGGSFYVMWEAHVRLITPVTVANEWVVVTGIMGGAGNYAVHRILHRVPAHERTTFLDAYDTHVLSDLLLSASVVLSALFAMLFGATKLDSYASIGIAGYMLFSAGRLYERMHPHEEGHEHCSH